jgi:hypothetical protein
VSQNTWPGGYTHTMSQIAHAAWNAGSYPGTRQMCARCDEPTDRCEEDARYVGDMGPLCADCDHLLDPEGVL